MQHAYGETPELELFTVGGDVRVEFGIGLGAIDDGGTGLARKVLMAADEVGVEVRFEDVLDRIATFRSAFHVRSYFAQRINDGCFAVVADVVRALCQATGVDLLEFHGCKDRYRGSPVGAVLTRW